MQVATEVPDSVVANEYRLTIIPGGKFQGAPLVALSNEDLATARREFKWLDPSVSSAIRSELMRRWASAKRRQPKRRRRAIS